LAGVSVTRAFCPFDRADARTLATNACAKRSSLAEVGYLSAVDWNLRTCGRKGHVTYAPAEPALRAKLQADTPVGKAWRCLRCGTFVVGAPHGEGPAADAPLVLRGRALRDAVILRLLAVERFAKGSLVLLAAWGVFRFRSRQDAVQRAFNEDLPLVKPIAEKIHYNLESSSIVHTLRTVIEANAKALFWIAVGLIVYGCLQLIEGFGLWLLKRWGEYFAVVATSFFIPIEIYELTERITWVRVGALIINIAAVIYILMTKRLFGIRGGHAAYEAERHEASLLEVETASDRVKLSGPPRRTPAAPGRL
jgi:uncharacterized membrane protein (DUF2068 family)